MLFSIYFCQHDGIAGWPSEAMGVKPNLDDLAASLCCRALMTHKGHK